MDNKPTSDGGDALMTFFIGAFIVLFVIRIEWYIDIPWIVVFSPLWLPIVLTLLVGIFISIFNKPKNKNDD